MLSAVKEALNKEIDVKEILTKEIDLKEFLEMEIELTKLKEVLATEVKLKEFLVQEIELSRLLSIDKPEDVVATELSDKELEESEALNRRKTDRRATDKYNSKRDLAAFDYTLVDTLKSEHKKIRFIFNQIMSYTIEKEYKKVAGQLEVFNKEIREHYQKADVELYAYIKTYVQMKHPKREKAFTQLSLEMKNLSIEIYFIMSQSVHIPLTEKSYDGFLKDFMAIGKLLNERISREESVLFKMYEQTHSAKSISE